MDENKDNVNEEIVDKVVSEHKSKRYTVKYINSTQFYQLPKFLFFGECKTKLSNDAKVLYALLKDRHELSMANGWVNENGEVYVIYTRDEMCEMLGCSSRNTLLKAINQLKDLGFLDEVQQGLRKPNLIYLKYKEQSYVDTLMAQEKLLKEELKEKHLDLEKREKKYKEITKERRIKAKEERRSQREKEQTKKSKKSDVQKMNVKENNEIKKPGRAKNERQEVQKMNVFDVQNVNVFDVQKMNGSKTDNINKTEVLDNNTDKNINDTLIAVPSINQSSEVGSKKENVTDNTIDMIDRINNITLRIKDNILYDVLIHDNPSDKQLIDNIVSIMVEVLTNTDKKTTYNIRGNAKPLEIVQSQFMKIDKEHIDYVMWCFRENTSEVKDIFKYLISTIYSAPLTMDTWYQARVSSDMKKFSV